MKNWQDKEHRDAVDFEFGLIPRSGSDRKNPGDSKSSNRNFLCDSKDTKQKGFRVTTTHFRKLIKEAIQQKRDIPILSVEIEDRRGTLEFVSLLKNDFVVLKQAYEELQNKQNKE